MRVQGSFLFVATDPLIQPTEFELFAGIVGRYISKYIPMLDSVILTGYPTDPWEHMVDAHRWPAMKRPALGREGMIERIRYFEARTVEQRMPSDTDLLGFLTELAKEALIRNVSDYLDSLLRAALHAQSNNTVMTTMSDPGLALLLALATTKCMTRDPPGRPALLRAKVRRPAVGIHVRPNATVTIMTTPPPLPHVR